MRHPGHVHALTSHEVLGWWTPRPFVLGAIALSLAWYAAGLARTWRRAGAGHGVRLREVVAFGLAQATLVAALVSPIDRLSELMFSVHMSQHELLMIVAAPLFVISRPVVAMLWALPDPWRLRVAHAASSGRFARCWRGLTHPLLVLVLHALALWIWHAPRLFEAALADDRIHTIEHLCFFVTALLFWWAVVHGRYGRVGYGVSVAYVFLTALHSSLLGALATLARTPWYATYVERGRGIAVDSLDDQRLAGLLMWAPAGLVFLVVGLALFAAWLGAAERQALANARLAIPPSTDRSAS